MRKEGEKMDEVVKPWSPKKKSTKGAEKKPSFRNSDFLMNGTILAVAVLIAVLLTAWITTARLEKRFELRLKQEVFQAEQNAYAYMRREFGLDARETEQERIQAEARTIAKILYPMQYNSDDGLRSAVWCVLNRVDSNLYPSTVEEVCSQRQQFMGWSEDNPILQRLYDIAVREVQVWHNGVHAIGTDYLWLEWTTKEITLRTTYEGGRGCHFWYESDWEGK